MCPWPAVTLCTQRIGAGQSFVHGVNSADNIYYVKLWLG